MQGRRSQHRLGAGVLAVGAWLCALAIAPPAVAATEGQASAQAHYQKGTRLYMVGEYRSAADEFKEGYLADADPAFLYNLARCHQRLGERDQAITFYRRYLGAAPGTPKRAEVNKEILALQSKGAAAAPAPQVPLTPAPATGEAKPPVYKRVWFWDIVIAALIGVVVALSAVINH